MKGNGLLGMPPFSDQPSLVRCVDEEKGRHMEPGMSEVSL